MQRIICAKSRKDWIRWLEYCHQECVAKQEKREREVFESDNMPKLIGALLMYRKDNVQHISKICNGAVVRYHATATASFKGRINESYNASTDCAQQAQVWSMQRGNCVCVFYYEVCLWGAQALQTNQGMILYKLFPVPQRKLSANGAWFNSGNNSSPRKKAPPNTTTWHPISWSNPTPCLFGWGEFSAYQVTLPTRSSKIHLMGGNS